MIRAMNNPIPKMRPRNHFAQSTQEQMREFVSVKYSKPYHSQLHANQIELLCIDDDPVFQVVHWDMLIAPVYIFTDCDWKQVVFKGLLGSLGYKIVRALSGNEAMELMWSRDHLPDLILLDIEMPTESGYEVCHQHSR